MSMCMCSCSEQPPKHHALSAPGFPSEDLKEAQFRQELQPLTVCGLHLAEHTLRTVGLECSEEGGEQGAADADVHQLRQGIQSQLGGEVIEQRVWVLSLVLLHQLDQVLCVGVCVAPFGWVFIPHGRQPAGLTTLGKRSNIQDAQYTATHTQLILQDEAVLRAQCQAWSETSVSYDIWMSSSGFLATLSPQVKLAHHPIQFHLVLAVIGPDVVETRGREERRRVSEEFTAAAYWEKHLHLPRHAPLEHPWL